MPGQSASPRQSPKADGVCSVGLIAASGLGAGMAFLRLRVTCGSGRCEPFPATSPPASPLTDKDGCCDGWRFLARRAKRGRRWCLCPRPLGSSVLPVPCVGGKSLFPRVSEKETSSRHVGTSAPSVSPWLFGLASAVCRGEISFSTGFGKRNFLTTRRHVCPFFTDLWYAGQNGSPKTR